MRRFILSLVALDIALMLAGCGSGGDDSAPPPASGPSVNVTGKVTYDRIPFDAVVGMGLNPAAPVETPAREITVEALAGSGAVLATTITNATGDYTLTVPTSQSMFLRAKAQMTNTGAAGAWDFRVLNNTNGDALYVLDGDSFDSGTANSVRNLRAPSGWNGQTYAGTRAAAPFAILDAAYRTKQLLIAQQPGLQLPPLKMFWSTSNRPSSSFCPDQGNVLSSIYLVGGGGRDDCTVPQVIEDGIYILGDYAGGAGDTDEFDAHVIAHELGHYFEDQFSRSDSIGGEHGSTDRLDLRVAFGEGWGNAYSAISLNDAVYRDSQQGVTSDFGFNLEADNTTAEGWFSELSVGEILYDIFDSAADPGDAVALGFGPIHSVMTGPQVSTDAFTSIFSFASALRSAQPAAAAAISGLLSGESISGTDAFGAGEGNNGGVVDVLPVYQDVTLNSTFPAFCTRAVAGSADLNKLGNRRFFSLDVPAGGAAVTVQVTGVGVGGTAAVDPDIYIYRRGALVAFSEGTTPGQETLSQARLAAGVHVIEIYDFDLMDKLGTRCMSATLQGQ